jgi:DUF1680 family protein
MGGRGGKVTIPSMNGQMPRRDFLKAAPVAVYALTESAKAALQQPSAVPSRNKVEAFDYQGVKLSNTSRWGQQYQSARDFYFGVSNDDILQGYRGAAGLPAPGRTLGGWCRQNSNTVFGQWLSGMSRMSRSLDDAAMREKIIYLFTEWAKTVKPDGDCGMRHYPFEKLVGGLVDMQLYAGYPGTTEMLEKVAGWASKNLDRTRAAAAPRPWELHSGTPLEWYTLSENLYRAYALTGNAKFKDFADVWLYPAYWNQFAESNTPTEAWGVHAYSHVNSFSSAAMAYAVTGEAKYLSILRNAFDFLQNTQTYATGGFGPSERIMPFNGNLGKALEYHQNTCETPCCSWAAFKLARYLTLFTGEARYGDWIEKLLYNGVGGILPIKDNGRHFYYADYRVSGGVKVYARDVYTCCSGTYCQAVAEYPNLVYFKDASSLHVSLYVPSEVIWNRPEGEVKLVQETRYPEAETSTFTVNAKQSADFALKFRVPGWSNDMAVKVNGAAASIECKPGTWAVVQRKWNSGDKVEVTIPMRFRYSAVDKWHPQRIAIVRGPVVIVQEGNAHEPVFKLPETNEDLNKWLVPSTQPGYFRMQPPDGRTVRASFLPFYAAIESLAYRMYFDNDKLPFVLW